jgi:glycosyltransferase involved in cell wall biosynthesis
MNGALEQGRYARLALAAHGAGHPRRVLLVLAEDAWFWTHRLPLARAARAAGFEVGVVTNSRASAARMRAEGFDFFHHDFRRAGIHPLHDLHTIRRLAVIYAAYRPDIVHHVAMKPVLFGSIAARWAGVRGVVNAVAGLGFALSSDATLARLIRPVVRAGLRVALAAPNSRLVVQNGDDAAYFATTRLVARDKIRLVCGVGVSVQRFVPAPEPVGVPLVVFVGRLLRDKGVEEFVAAARHLRRAGVDARFALVGSIDANPRSLTAAELDQIAAEGVVEVWGQRSDMHEVYRSASIVCLPSYREGLPKVLLEAAACGRAVVATDVPGCREVVQHGETGLLVPPREVEPLVGALLCLIRDRALRQRLGAAGRVRVLRQFTEDRAVDQTLAVYRELVPDWPGDERAAASSMDAPPRVELPEATTLRVGERRDAGVRERHP